MQVKRNNRLPWLADQADQGEFISIVLRRPAGVKVSPGSVLAADQTRDTPPHMSPINVIRGKRNSPNIAVHCKVKESSV